MNKKRKILICASVFYVCFYLLFFISTPALALSCGSGGTCKGSCITPETPGSLVDSSACTNPTESVCCLPGTTTTTCASPNTCKTACATGETEVGALENNWCALNKSGTKYCCKPATTTTTPAPGTGTTGTTPAPTAPEATGPIKLRLEQPFSSLTGQIEISGSTIGKYIKALYTFGSSAIVALAIVMVIIGGVRWILSAGNPEAIGKAKDTIMKSLLGLFIALFAIFMLQTLSPGTVTFKEITPEGIQGQAIVLPTVTGPPTATCQDDLSKECNTAYTDTFGNSCVGKDCSKVGSEKVCLKSDSTWSCVDCKKIDESCTTNTDCCEGACDTTTTKCVASTTIAGGLGQSCDSSHPCPAPLICETNWFNSCSYGGLGNPCSKDSECNQAEGYYCDTEGSNVCLKKIQLGRCDSTQSNDKVCPSGYSCKGASYLVYCDTMSGMAGQDYGNIVCPNGSTFEGNKDSICLKNLQTSTGLADPCVCDCDSDSDCNGINYPGSGGDAAPKCQTDGVNYCTSGQYGSPCKINTECISGICMTYGKKMCSQGAVGEGCANGSECRKESKCCKNVCVPDAFSCPTTASDN